MPRPKGSQNKLTTEVKNKLQNLIDEVVNRIDVDSMTIDQKLKLLQLSLHYVLPKLRSTETTEKKYEDEPIFIEVFERKDDEEERNLSDNFKVTYLKNCINLSIISATKIK